LRESPPSEKEICNIGGYKLHPGDLLFAVIYCAAGALVRRYGSRLELSLLVLGGLQAVNFFRGLAGPSAVTAGNAFRGDAIFNGIVAFIYVWGRTLNPDWVFNKIVVLGWGIVLVSVANLASGNSADFSCETCEARPLNSSAALMLGQALLIAFNQAISLPPGAERWRKGATFLVFLAGLLISQQRTATVATLAGLAVILAFAPRYYRSIAIGAGYMALLAVAAVFWSVWVGDGDVAQDLPRAISWVINAEGTYGWRVRQWEQYLDIYWNSPLVDQIVGPALGVLTLAAAQSDEANSLRAGTHSQYINLLLDSGIVGVLLFTSVLVFAMIKGLWLLLHSTGAPNQPRLRWAVAVVVCSAIFSYTYTLPPQNGLPLALAIQIIGMGRAAEREASLPRTKRFARGMARLG
jgi:hypothetical protein